MRVFLVEMLAVAAAIAVVVHASMATILTALALWHLWSGERNGKVQRDREAAAKDEVV